MINPKIPNSLLASMKNPENVIKESAKAVVIQDKYPKAKIHYLVLPREDISSIFKLTKDHVSLIEEFNRLFEEIKVENKHTMLSAGFHAIPSMHRLHMHIISMDFISPSLKTKTHWNSFNTKFFIPCSEVLKTLKQEGSIDRMTEEMHRKLISRELQCNQCDFKPRNMPLLKKHLLTHEDCLI